MIWTYIFRFSLELTFFACHAKKVTKKDHRFLNFPRKSELIFPPDSGNSACKKQASNSPESSHKSLLKINSIFFVKFKRRINPDSDSNIWACRRNVLRLRSVIPGAVGLTHFNLFATLSCSFGASVKRQQKGFSLASLTRVHT